MAYAKRECICIIDKKNGVKEIQRLICDSEDIIEFACSFSDMGEKYIAAGYKLNLYLVLINNKMVQEKFKCGKQKDKNGKDTKKY